MTGKKSKYVVVTPYFKEEPAVLARCIQSVKRQTVATDHFLVADGFPQEWVDYEGIRHIRLDCAHGDYGGVAKAVGGILAVGDQYESIAFLDADNWFDENHVEACLQAAQSSETCDYVVARQRLTRPDGTIMNISPEPVESHVDTNCYFLLKGAFHAIPIWGLMPKPATPVCDRFFYAALLELGLQKVVLDRPTVNYQSLWEIDYRRLGEIPPPNAKPNIDSSKVQLWRNSLSPRERVIAERLMRVKL